MKKLFVVIVLALLPIGSVLANGTTPGTAAEPSTAGNPPPPSSVLPPPTPTPAATGPNPMPQGDAGMPRPSSPVLPVTTQPHQGTSGPVEVVTRVCVDLNRNMQCDAIDEGVRELPVYIVDMASGQIIEVVDPDSGKKVLGVRTDADGSVELTYTHPAPVALNIPYVGVYQPLYGMGTAPQPIRLTHEMIVPAAIP